MRKAVVGGQRRTSRMIRLRLNVALFWRDNDSNMDDEPKLKPQHSDQKDKPKKAFLGDGR